jgi:phospholipase/carboxylesterase
MNFKRIQYFDHPCDAADRPWIILFHGFGADAHDLEGLRDYISVNSQVNWRFPNGVFEVPIGPGWTGRAWWPLTLSSLPGDWSDYTPDSMPALVPAILKMIEDLKIPWNKVILGGFSQGAMLATEIYLQAPEQPLGLISMSGSLIRQNEWAKKLEARKGAKVFLCHGENDQVLSIKGSQKLLNLFKQNGLDTQWVSFGGGHEIPPKALQGVTNYINGLL